MLKISDAGVKVAAGAGVLTPVPDNATCWGLPAALPEIESVPVRLPVAIGVNVTVTVQLAPADNAEPQLLVWAKSPPALTFARERLPLPEFVSVMVCAGLVEFKIWLEKARLETETTAVEELVSDTEAELLEA